MRRHLLYVILGLGFSGVAATATDRYGEWSLDRLRNNVVTLTYTQNAPPDDNSGETAEFGIICIEKDRSKRFGGTLLPFEGAYENAQDEVVVLLHKGLHYAPPDLSQKWENARDYLFLDSQGEIDKLVGYLKTSETNGEKSVYLSFSGDLLGRPAMLNVVTIDLSGFSAGFAALQTACAAPR
jgi:hypothetical protein